MELSFPRMWALVRNDLRILRSDPAFVLIFTIMPLAFMVFTKGAFGASLAVQYPGRGLTGAEQVVPGAAVMFSGFMVGNLGFGIFREHSWATWDRLRASQLGTAEIMIAKGVTPMLVLILQMTVMLGAGALLFDLHLAGSVPAFVLVALALALMELTLGFALLALCKSTPLPTLGRWCWPGLAGRLLRSSYCPAGPRRWRRSPRPIGRCGGSPP